MRPLGHEHHAFVAEIGGYVDELVERKIRLSPRTGITHRMQQCRETHERTPSATLLCATPSINRVTGATALSQVWENRSGAPHPYERITCSGRACPAILRA